MPYSNADVTNYLRHYITKIKSYTRSKRKTRIGKLNYSNIKSSSLLKFTGFVKTQSHSNTASRKPKLTFLKWHVRSKHRKMSFSEFQKCPRANLFWFSNIGYVGSKWYLQLYVDRLCTRMLFFPRKESRNWGSGVEYFIFLNRHSSKV